MSGVSVIRRRERVRAARPLHHVTKAQHAEDLRAAAVDLHAFADQSRAAAAALKALDRADRLDQHPRCGWYPIRPKEWRP